MALTSPNIITYAQAAALLQQIQDSTEGGAVQDLQTVATQLATALTQFEAGATRPVFKYQKIEFGDPPLSDVINSMWNNIATDINLLTNQADILRAAAVTLYNLTTTELLQINNVNGEILNQIATVSLFNNTIDSKTFIFSDQFASGGNIDSVISINDSLAQIDNGYLSLAEVGQNVNLSTNATIKILPQSNGFPGDNQEIEDPTNVGTNPITSNPQYIFVGSVNNPSQPQVVLDNHSPNTFFEYEAYLVQPNDRTTAKNFNFTYAVAGSEITQYPNTTNGQIDWAAGPNSGYLDLFIQADIGSVQEVNTITYTPYGLVNDINYPILIQQISLSSNGTTWVPALQNPVWVGTIANQQAASVGANVAIGTATFNVGSQFARYIKLELRQPNSILCNIGHIYYVDPDTNNRIQGPVPDVSTPLTYYNSGQTVINGFTQFVEYFQGKRWVIGINGLSIEQNQFQATSTMVTKPIFVNGTVDRVAIDAEIVIPPDFDSSQNWVNFSISPDNGNNWYPISPIQNYVQGINEVIAFNDPLPAAFKDPNVTYITTDLPVTSLRVMITLIRPDNKPSETPVVKNYQVHVRIL